MTCFGEFEKRPGWLNNRQRCVWTTYTNMRQLQKLSNTTLVKAFHSIAFLHVLENDRGLAKTIPF